MQKLLAILIILVMVAPALGLACGCCPAGSEKVSSPVISSPDCSCCPQTMELNGQKGMAQENQKSVFITSLTRLLAFFTVMAEGLRVPNLPELSSRAFDPSPRERSSKTPLFLTLEVLRT